MTQRLVDDPAFAAKVLSEADVCHLAFVDGDVPYVVPLSFVHLDGRVYFHSSLDGHKMDLVRRQPKVALLAYVIDRKVSGDKACAFGVRYRSVQATGIAREITDVHLKLRALNALALKEAGGRQLPPVRVEEIQDVAVVEIELLKTWGKENA